jgi:arylformamidase
VSGHSAGGHQVARLLGTNWPDDYGLPSDVIKGGLSISGLFDLRPLRFSFLQPMLQLTAEIVQTESPLFTLPIHAVPLIASVGGIESPEFRRQSAEFIEVRKSAGLPGFYSEQPGRNHYTAIEGFANKDSELCKLLKATHVIYRRLRAPLMSASAAMQRRQRLNRCRRDLAEQSLLHQSTSPSAIAGVFQGRAV